MSDKTKQEKDHERYLNNRETMKANALEYYEEHKDEINAKRRETYRQRADEIRDNATCNRQPWSVNDLVQLQLYITEGLTVPQIANKIGRTENAIKNILRTQRWRDFQGLID